MKTNPLMTLVLVVGLAGILGYAAYQLGVHKGMQSAASEVASHPNMPIKEAGSDQGRKVLYWHDPMVPTQKFDQPGKSPFMDMPLQPVYADGNQDGNQVTIDSRVRQNLGIRTAEVTSGTLSSTMEVVGNVAYNERDVVLVQARANGFIEKLYVRAPLDPVRKGQALAQLYVPDWVAAQEEFLTVKKMGGSVSSALLDGSRQRMRLAGMSTDQVNQVESAGKLQARLTIYAPSAGVVSELSAREGMTVMAGAPLFRINGISSVWVNAEIPESMAAQIRPGSLVQARSPALSDVVLQGHVSAILPQVDATTRTLQARIELANPGGKLVPGMFVNVSLAPAKPDTDMLMVPSEAIIQTGTRKIVMLAEGDGKFMPVDVETGIEADIEKQGMTQVLKGLHAGQTVVVSGQFLIDSEASLRGITTRLGDVGMATSNHAMAPQTHRARGKVEAIGKDDITLSHEPIASLHWGAMTMGFKLPAQGLPKTIVVGNKVVFEIQETKAGDYQITRIDPVTAPVAQDGNKDMSDMQHMHDMTGAKK